MTPTTPHHVVLLTYGEPPTPAFVDQLVYSWRILLGLTRTVAPIPKAVIPAIALSRGWGRYKLWSEREYGSPLESITEQQAASLRSALQAEQGEEWVVHVAYEFRRPLIDDVVAGIPSDAPVSIVPMYVTDSAFTHGLSRQNVAAMLARLRRTAPVRVVPPLDPDHFAELAAEHVMQHVGEDGAGPSTALALAAHGTLLNPEKPIDTGLAATEQVCRAIQARLEDRFGFVINGWLNHSRGGKWTEPPMDEALRRVRDAGFSKLVYFPYGFLADNAESELEGRMAVEPYPGLETRFIPCLNESMALAHAIALTIRA